ncbi:MAG TPA: type 4a pilus biogenesis protein PilO [Candidatus Saccharibacteria bacterium]|nr:type 4a pilus biogenesis protein PilO [Candidatus Saccharibacteria bacterium]
MNNKNSQKHTQVEKLNSAVVLTVAVSAFVIVFALVASRALWTKMSYQNRVISAKEEARDQLRDNIDQVDELVIAYKAFSETPNNVLGGSSNGKSENSGDNAKLTLDSLPSKYDFPALTTSVEKLVKSTGSKVGSISGTDDEVSQQDQSKEGVIEIPFDLTAEGNYASIVNLMKAFNLSIRPISIKAIEFSGTNEDFSVSLSAKSYYQPARTLEVTKKVVK